MLAMLGTAAGQEAGSKAGSEPQDDAPAEEISRPRAVRRVAPHFPDEALAANISFVECLATVSVDVAGSPTNVIVSGCPDLFFESVEDALMRWRFEPTMADGAPVATEFELTIYFKRGDIDLGNWEAFKAVIAAYSPLDDPADQCVVTMTTHPDGSMSNLSSNRLPECMIVPSYVRRPKNVQRALAQDVVCTAHVDVKSGNATSVEVSGCDEPFAAHAKHSLKLFHYNYVDGKSEYEVRMTLDAQ